MNIDDTYDFEDVAGMTIEECKDYLTVLIASIPTLSYQNHMDLKEKVHEIMLNNLPEPDIDSYKEQQIINQEEESEGVHPNE